jgi:streptomycin 6-kinase
VIEPDARARLEDRLSAWNVVVERRLETPSSILALGTRDGEPVALKVVREPGDEWRSGAVVHAFGGSGVVRVIEYIDGALLLERLQPGTSLVELSLSNRDDQATDIIADVIQRMPVIESMAGVPTVEDWGVGFTRYLQNFDGRLSHRLVEAASKTYSSLCATQQNTRLLHGDLQHFNVLFDDNRGWVAIDPKGVVGEVAFELGAALRNPWGRPDLLADPELVGRRISRYSASLKLDAGRVLSWCFAQAVLSAVWTIEDRGPDTDIDAMVLLAKTARAMLK